MSRILVDRYMIALRVAQPARVQDIIKTVLEIWPDMVAEDAKPKLTEIHELMRKSNSLVSVRRGTYVLSAAGVAAVGGLQKERIVDNARIFLMKSQRKRYHNVARRLG